MAGACNSDGASGGKMFKHHQTSSFPMLLLSIVKLAGTFGCFHLYIFFQLLLGKTIPVNYILEYLWKGFKPPSRPLCLGCKAGVIKWLGAPGVFEGDLCAFRFYDLSKISRTPPPVASCHRESLKNDTNSTGRWSSRSGRYALMITESFEGKLWQLRCLS